jgi:hypothetical protein
LPTANDGDVVTTPEELTVIPEIGVEVTNVTAPPSEPEVPSCTETLAKFEDLEPPDSGDD